jgi:hypothetical protein
MLSLPKGLTDVLPVLEQSRVGKQAQSGKASRLLKVGKFERTIATGPRNPAVFGGAVVRKKSSSEEMRFVRP